MSRLADALMGMDRGAERPHGVGGIPPLAMSSGARPKWLWGGLLVIVAGMATLTVGAVLRSRVSVAAVDARPASRAASVATAAPSRPTADQRFVSLVKAALRSAEDGELVEAARLLKSALELRPQHAETWNSLGVVLVRANEAPRGIDAFRQALLFDPNHTEAHRNLAVALDRQGKSGEAVSALSRVSRVERRATSGPGRCAAATHRGGRQGFGMAEFAQRRARAPRIASTTSTRQ